MDAVPGSLIPMASVANLRDLGGWPTTGGGRVRFGLLYRSTELSRLSGDDEAALARLGVRTVFDLRTGAERSASPDRVPPGATHLVADVLADSTDAAPAALAEVLTDPAAAQRLLGDGRAAELFARAYREIVSLPSALAAYRLLVTEIAREPRRPALFHCTTGKDRTGWAAASVLLLLGVSEEDVLRDYEYTNRDLLPALAPLMERFRSAGGDPELLRPVLDFDRAYLQAALDEMRTRFGSVEGYFADGLGVDAAVRDALRSALVASSASAASSAAAARGEN